MDSAAGLSGGPQTGLKAYTNDKIGNLTSKAGVTITAPATARYGFEAYSVYSTAGQCYCFAYAPNTGAWVFSGAAGVSENGTCLTSGNPPTPQMTRTAFLQTGGRMAITVTPAFAGAGSPQTRRWARLTGSGL